MARLGLIQRALRQAYREARAAGVPDEITHGYLRFGPDGMTPAAKRARAAEGGFQHRLFHGTGRDFKAFELGARPTTSADGNDAAVFLTKDPIHADAYARTHLFDADKGMSPAPSWDLVDVNDWRPQVVPVYARGRLRRFSDSPRFIASRIKGFRDEKAKGYEGSMTPYGTEVAIFDPSNIRSPNATFDPRRRHWNNLLAATTAGAPIGLLALLARRDDEVA